MKTIIQVSSDFFRIIQNDFVSGLGLIEQRYLAAMLEALYND